MQKEIISNRHECVVPIPATLENGTITISLEEQIGLGGKLHGEIIIETRDGVSQLCIRSIQILHAWAEYQDGSTRDFDPYEDKEVVFRRIRQTNRSNQKNCAVRGLKHITVLIHLGFSHTITFKRTE